MPPAAVNCCVGARQCPLHLPRAVRLQVSWAASVRRLCCLYAAAGQHLGCWSNCCRAATVPVVTRCLLFLELVIMFLPAGGVQAGSLQRLTVGRMLAAGPLFDVFACRRYAGRRSDCTSYWSRSRCNAHSPAQVPRRQRLTPQVRLTSTPVWTSMQRQCLSAE